MTCEYYVHMSNGTYTGFKSRSFKKAVEFCNDYSMPADVNKLDFGKSSFSACVYSNLKNSDNIYLRRYKH